MRIIFTGLFIGALILSGFPQKIDSLRSELEKHPEASLSRLEILNQLGYEYWIVNPVESIFYGQKAYHLAEVLQDTTGLAFASRVIGVAHWARGVYDAALTNLYQGRQLYKAVDDLLGQANCIMNIGLVYSDQGDHHRALDQYADALRLFQDLNEEQRIATTYNKMGTSLLELGNLVEAKDYLDKGLEIHREYGYQYGISESLNRLGLYFHSTGQFDASIAAFNKSITLSKRINDREGLAKNFENLASVHLDINNPIKARKLLEDGAEIAREIGSNKWLKEIYFDLKNLYQSQGDYQKAIFYSERYIALRDSIFNEEIARNIANFEAQLLAVEKEKLINDKQKEIAILEEKRRGDLIIRIAIIVSFIFLGIIALLISGKKRQKLQLEHEQSERRARELDLELEMKNKELTSYTVNFVQKNQLFEDLKEILRSVKHYQGLDPLLRQKFREFDRIISNQLQVDKDWEDFKLRFQNLHQHFFDQLLGRNSSLTNHELRLSALIRLNFSMKEIGNILGISTESVKTARYRLKKKLDLPVEKNLNDYLNELGS